MNKALLSSFLVIPVLLTQAPMALQAVEYHVSPQGSDSQRGTRSSPFRTIQRAANLAQPGDVITVHAGTYRERINPPRGGSSEKQRIVYQAARGEVVDIKGSEVIKNWVKVQDNVWKATIPNSFFGSLNPYQEVIHGDWFDGRGRKHHTGAVYLNGEWLIEAAKLEEVMMPVGTPFAWLNQAGRPTLLNVAWLRPGEASGSGQKVPANKFSAQEGIQTAPCTEGGECIGWIEDGDWVKYENVDLGQSNGQIEFRSASATDGGIIEVRLDSPSGELLGKCTVPNTGGWQSWSSYKAKIKPMSGVRTLCLLFKNLPSEAAKMAGSDAPLWFAEVDGSNTTIWAQFPGVNPNEQLVEINVRRAVFYPDQPGRNYITIRGFRMRHAATQWAPPTSEQVGLIGTHWSKGWIIENNVVSHSVCSGIALGKHGDKYDNTSADTAEGYVKTIERAHAFPIPWTKEKIGHHVVRNNTISHCEQAGVVGSLGAAFSTVTGNTIHDIHVRRLFTGAEMAGIKFHAAIDSVISDNHIYRTCLGLWLDWMAQGTRVSRNRFHDNLGQDLFVEVNHGPFMVDHNLFLSKVSLLDVSEGGAYAHNLFLGKIISSPEPNRETPYHPAHSTTVAGLVKILGGDDRFYNNIFVGEGRPVEIGKDSGWQGSSGLHVYDARPYPLQTGGNVYYRGAHPYRNESDPLVLASQDPQVKVVQRGGQFYLRHNFGTELKQAKTKLVTTATLGKAKIPGLPYENADGTPLKIDRDLSGKKQSASKPTPGPFANPGKKEFKLELAR